MHGKKIKGDFALFQMKGRGERSWILVKKNDEFASEEDITEDDKSVKSGKTLVQVAKANGTTVNHPEANGKESGTKSQTAAGKAVQLLSKTQRKSTGTKAAKK